MTSITTDRRALALWLLVCSALIFAMIVLGGVTRLTRSGLSIVEWKPVAGAIPPLTAQQWQQEFEKYRQTPEYRKVNYNITLEGFKSIYWVEYTHRLLGRVIGLVVLLPLIYFLVRRRIDKALAYRLGIAFALGGLQALVGWLMVASGLRDDPRVSPYWLVTHLTMAIVIYGYVLWTAFDLLWPERLKKPPAGLLRYAVVFLALLLCTIVAGGFVAGTRAGLVFNTFPLMNGKFLPDGAYATAPLWRDWFENVATVQFHHRLLAYATLFTGVLLWWRTQQRQLVWRAYVANHGLLGMLLLQLILGVATVINFVPIYLGAAHQAGALLLLTLALLLLHALGALARTK